MPPRTRGKPTCWWSTDRSRTRLLISLTELSLKAVNKRWLGTDDPEKWAPTWGGARTRDRLRGLGHQGAQAEITHQRGQAGALRAGFFLQGLQVLFGKAHQDLGRQLSLLAVAHVFLRHLG